MRPILIVRILQQMGDARVDIGWRLVFRGSPHVAQIRDRIPIRLEKAFDAWCLRQPGVTITGPLCDVMEGDYFVEVTKHDLIEGWGRL